MPPSWPLDLSAGGELADPLLLHATRRWLAAAPLGATALARWHAQRRALITLAMTDTPVGLILDSRAACLPGLAAALSTLDAQAATLDVVLLHTPGPGLPWPLDPLPSGPLPGYALTRRAALRFLALTPWLVRPFDDTLLRPWATGLAVSALAEPVLGELAPEAEPETAPYPEAERFWWRASRGVVAGAETARRALWRRRLGVGAG